MERRLSTESTKQIEVVKRSATTALERALSKEKKALLKNKKAKSTNSVSDDMQGQEILWIEEQVGETGTKKAGLFRSFRAAPVPVKSPAKPQIVLVEQDDEATRFSKRQEAAEKAAYARRLLHAALSREPSERTEFDGRSHEVLLTDAFQAAADSRRLVERETDEEELSKSASRGKREVREAWKIQEQSIFLPPSQRPKRIAVPKKTTDGTPSMVPPPKDPAPKGPTLLHDMANAANEALRQFQEHAEEARRQLESMLPGFLVNVFSSDDEEERPATKQKDKNADLQEGDDVEKSKPKETEEEEVEDDDDDEEKVAVVSVGTLRDQEIVRVVVEQQRLPAFSPRASPPFLPQAVDPAYSPHMGLSATISTLGFDNTFEEKTLANDKNPITPDQGNAISVSSLNEFMDGDGNDADEIARKRKKLQKAKSVPAVIASKPMHEPTKPQNKPIFSNLLQRKKNKAASTAALGSAVGVASMKTKSPSRRKERSMEKFVIKNEKEDRALNDDNALMSRDNIQKTEDAIKEAMMKAHIASVSASMNGPKQGIASPSFVAAPVIANGLMTPQSWGSLVSGQSLDEILMDAEGERKGMEFGAREAAVSVDEVPKETGKTRKFGFFKKLRGKNKEKVAAASAVAAIVETSEAVPEEVASVVSHPKVAVPSSPAKKQVTEQALPTNEEIPLIRSDDSRPDMGDKYTALMDDETDEAADEAKKRLENKAPIVSDVDMMLTSEPNVLSEIRNVFSMDCGNTNDVQGVAVFGKVEVGDDENAHTEGTLLNRELVIKALNTPRHEAVPATKIPIKRTTTTHGPQGLTASDSFMEELEVKKVQTLKVVNTPTKTKPARFWGSPKRAFSKGSATKVDAKTVVAEADPKPSIENENLPVGKGRSYNETPALRAAAMAAVKSKSTEKPLSKYEDKKSRFGFMKRKSFGAEVAGAEPISHENMPPVETRRVLSDWNPTPE